MSLNDTRFSSLLDKGFSVFPLAPNSKVPIDKWGEFQHRHASDKEVASWDRSNFNVGVATGKISQIAVIDADDQEAIDFIEAAGLEPTPWVQTSRGRHYCYRYPSGGVGNRVHVGGKALDVRGDGGYVVGVGSRHPDGTLYEWGLSPDDVPFAPFPAHLISAANPKARTRAVTPAFGGDDGQLGIGKFLAAELSSACETVRLAVEGTRNNKLYQCAKDLAKHVCAAGADWAPYADALAAAAAEAGADGIEGTLASAWKSGSEAPTAWVRAASECVYLMAQDRFYFPRSGTYLIRAGFHGGFGHSAPGVKNLASYVLDEGFIRKVSDIVYNPTLPQGIVEIDGESMYNVYRPSAVVATPGDASPFEEFLQYLVPVDAEREHLLKVIAYTVRHPGERVRHILLLRSKAQGIGKSLLGLIWGELLGSSNVRKTSTSEILGSFEGWAVNCTGIIVEEMDGNVGMHAYNKLKDFVTAETRSINEKHLRPRTWHLFGTIAMFSNREAPILIEEDDRRVYMIDTDAKPREPGYYKGLAAWLKANIGVVRHYIDQVDLSDFNPHAPPPMTGAKQGLIARSHSVLAQDLLYLLRAGEGPFSRDLVTQHEVRATLPQNARISDRELAKALGEIGAVRLGQVGKGYERKSLWAARHGEYWSYVRPVDQLKEHCQEEGMLSLLNYPGVSVRHASQWPGERPFDEDWTICSPR